MINRCTPLVLAVKPLLLYSVCYRAFLNLTKMEAIIIQLIFTALNIACAFWQYELKNYKIAIFNGFAAGVCFMGFLNAL